MWKWWHKYFGPGREEKLRAINSRLDNVVQEIATINGESKWMLKIEREKGFPQTFECNEVKKHEG